MLYPLISKLICKDGGDGNIKKIGSEKDEIWNLCASILVCVVVYALMDTAKKI